MVSTNIKVNMLYHACTIDNIAEHLVINNDRALIITNISRKTAIHYNSIPK